MSTVSTGCIASVKYFSAFFSSRRACTRNNKNMLRAIGVVIILWYVSHIFTQSFSAADDAGKATFKALEAAAVASQKNFE